jgi:ferredoxin-NADP reductase/ferredoxin
MYNKKALLVSNPMLPNHVITINPELCVSCYQCSDICRCNVIVHNPEKDKPPILLYPDECWHCAVCTENCPTGAITFEHPINQKITWKRKDTGEIMRIGMKNPPEPNTRKACGDRSIPVPKHQTVEMEIVEKKQLSRFVVYVKLSNASADISNYQPGHFCNVKLDDETFRAYSIGNMPGNNSIELYIDTFPNGPGAQFFNAAQVGQKVQVTTPLGRFVYTPKETPVLLIGSVTGIAPVKAMVEQELLKIKSGRRVKMLFLVWDEADIFLKDYFDSLVKEYPNFSYNIILTNPDTTAEKTGDIYNGTVIDYIRNSDDITADMDAYICGAKHLIKVVESELFKKNIFWQNIKYESFM